jgi:hypothetical protein
MFARLTLATTLITFALSAAGASAQTKTGGNGQQPPQPADLVLVNMQINEAAKTVAVTVRLEARIGLRGVPVRLTVSGAGATLFDQTKSVDMPLNTTKTVTFTNVNIAAFKAQVAQQPLQAARFLSVSAKVDPANTIPEGNEGNNLFFRILPVN